MSTTARWVPLPGSPPLIRHQAPYLIASQDVPQVADALAAAGATVRYLSLEGVSTSTEFFAGFKGVLVFPDWCGAGWDSFDDAFQEILAASPFPLVMVVDGLQDLLAHAPHLALATVMHLYEASRACSAAGVQFEVLYAGDGWR